VTNAFGQVAKAFGQVAKRGIDVSEGGGGGCFQVATGGQTFCRVIYFSGKALIGGVWFGKVLIFSLFGSHHKPL
jgi:hypothetical protein